MAARRKPDGTVLRGTSNTNARGSAKSRRARKAWVLAWFGDGISCLCYSCGAVLLSSTLEIDRIIPGILGGTYARGNIRPSCSDCNIRSGNAVKALLRAGISKTKIIRMCRLGLL
jgi:5-methylcytosine-specific restriction endonuclease McrA